MADGDGLRSAIEAAIDKAGPEPTQAELPLATGSSETHQGEPPAGPIPVSADLQAKADAPEERAPTNDRARDELGRFKAKDGEAPQKPAEVSQEPVRTVPQQPTPVEFKPPQSLRPSFRELENWKKVPTDVQEEFIRVDQAAKKALQDSAEARDRYQAFREAVAPYEALIRAEGSDPIRAVSTLLQGAAALRMAPPQHRANLIADLIVNHLPGREGVELLDQAIASRMGGQAAPTAAPSRVQSDPRVDAMYAEFERAKQQYAAAQQERVKSQIAEVSGLEFFEDVRPMMAHIIEASKRYEGVELTAKEAYDRAVWANPHTREVLVRRQQAQGVTNPQGSTARSMAAASSVRSQPAGPATAEAPKDLRGAIEAAWDAVSRR